MDGAQSQRMVKVGRSFEWSRLENELMTSVYERVLPVARSVRTDSSLADHEHGRPALGRSEGHQPRYATGA
jgi:hypothetical protein